MAHSRRRLAALGEKLGGGEPRRHRALAAVHREVFRGADYPAASPCTQGEAELTLPSPLASLLVLTVSAYAKQPPRLPFTAAATVRAGCGWLVVPVCQTCRDILELYCTVQPASCPRLDLSEINYLGLLLSRMSRSVKVSDHDASTFSKFRHSVRIRAPRIARLPDMRWAQVNCAILCRKMRGHL
jgi:hypothetical protein